jgi:hypothetical protein
MLERALLLVIHSTCFTKENESISGEGYRRVEIEILKRLVLSKSNEELFF